MIGRERDRKGEEKWRFNTLAIEIMCVFARGALHHIANKFSLIKLLHI